MEALLQDDPSQHYCQRCRKKKLICKKKGPGDVECKHCKKEGLNCVWHGDTELEKRSRAQLSDSSEDQAPGKRLDTKFRFLCPFFLKHPERYRRVRSCSGDGYVDFHRLKEHISRVHKIPRRCRTCFLEFKTEIGLADHLYETRDKPCQPAGLAPEFQEGCDNSQVEALKAIKKTKQADIEKWNRMWKILFPRDLDCEVINPAEYFANRYSGLINHLLNNLEGLKELATRSSDSVTTEELLAGLRKYLRIVEPGSSDSCAMVQSHIQHSISIGVASVSNNPFRKSGVPVPLTSASRTETVSQIAPVDTGFQPTSSQVSHLSTGLNQHSRARERPYINQTETRVEAPSTALSSGPEAQHHYDYSQQTDSSIRRMHNENMFRNVPFRPQHMPEDWPGTQDLTSQRYHNPNVANPFFSTTDFGHTPQTQSMAQQVDNSIQAQLDYIELGWSPDSDPSAPEFRYK